MIPCKITLVGDKNYARNFIGAGQSQLRILENQMSFQNLKQGIRRVRFNSRAMVETRVCFGLKEVIIYCLPAIIKGKGKKYERLPKLYVYVTISDYVTIWDLLTGEVAEDICNNEGHVNNEDGDPLVTFPCHKDELVTWLKGIKDRPTRQVLKDEPEDRKDYLDDNKKDQGCENRILKRNPEDPSAGNCSGGGCTDCYYGLTDPVNFADTTTNSGMEPPIICCPPPCTHPPGLGGIMQYGLVTANNILTPIPEDDPIYEKVKESFACNNVTSHHYDCYAFWNGTLGLWCVTCKHFNQTRSYVKYLRVWKTFSKHLYLCRFPSPHYYLIAQPEIPIEYCCPDTTVYEEPINFDVDVTYFNCYYYIYRGEAFVLSRTQRHGTALTINTDLGNLLLDYRPARGLIEDVKSLAELMSEAALSGNGCFGASIPDGVCTTLKEFEQVRYFWEDSPYDNPVHATGDCAWCRKEEQESVNDVLPGENTRYGISWCGSIYDYRKSKDVDEEGNPQTPIDQTDGWYRVLFRFFMGKFFTSGHETRWNDFELGVCPTPSDCEGSGGTCESTEWSNISTAGRISSVQATIELEKPQDYPKDRTSKITKRIDGIETSPTLPSAHSGTGTHVPILFYHLFFYHIGSLVKINQ